MRVAVPLFGNDVAPRFGFAVRFLIVEIADEQIVITSEVETAANGWPNRLSDLSAMGVEVLLCGGFNRAFVPLAEDLGIRVLAGLAGDALKVAEAFARGQAMPTFTCSGMTDKGRGGPRCGRGQGRKRGKGRRAQQSTYRPEKR